MSANSEKRQVSRAPVEDLNILFCQANSPKIKDIHSTIRLRKQETTS